MGAPRLFVELRRETQGQGIPALRRNHVSRTYHVFFFGAQMEGQATRWAAIDRQSVKSLVNSKLIELFTNYKFV